jgi:predicted nicotinamide N-methyase
MELTYRLKRRRERLGKLELELETLADLNETIDALFAKLEAEGRPELLETLCPYFGVVWPAARALVAVLQERGPDALAGRRVLEVGCGLALPTLVAARLGAQVTATDFHPEVPRFLRANVELNGVTERVRYVELDWRRGVPPEMAGAFDLVVGSDVLYERQHALEVAGTLAGVVRPGGEILLADPARPYLQAFADAMRAQGFAAETRVLTVPDEPQSKDIFVLGFRSPG